MMETNSFFDAVILTAGVFAALVTSIANIIIALTNNNRLKKIESQKHINEIDKYRYSRLYELILNWHQYDSIPKGENAGEIAFYRLLNLFLDDSGRYEIIKPLLDKVYVDKLEIKKKECEKLLNALIEAEAPDGTHSEDFFIIKENYFNNGKEFSKILKETINCQLEILLEKSSSKSYQKKGRK
ncbi:MAG: hypothetical protein NC205_00780 [Prevotella sp.]|nr:hypothetical protein [Alistipes senegalensis]MCM1357097.1 hypothetical protein [Prevotella sp.]MCM1472581.1 hypothetical protein [Muribaculaceae bacterium]